MKKENNNLEHKKNITKNIFSLLASGEELTQKELAGKTGLNGSVVRDYIRSGRRFGLPFCSDYQVGYWITKDPAEIREQINNAEYVIKGYRKTIRGLQKCEKRARKGKLTSNYVYKMIDKMQDSDFCRTDYTNARKQTKAILKGIIKANE